MGWRRGPWLGWCGDEPPPSEERPGVGGEGPGSVRGLLEQTGVGGFQVGMQRGAWLGFKMVGEQGDPRPVWGRED